MSRSLTPILLIGLVLTCPILCGPGGPSEIGHGSECGGASGDPCRNDGGGGCPEDRDNCVCRGAIQSVETRLDTTFTLATSSVFLIAAVDPPIPPRHHLTWAGEPTGLAGWGDALTVRAYLQNFRF